MVESAERTYEERRMRFTSLALSHAWKMDVQGGVSNLFVYERATFGPLFLSTSSTICSRQGSSRLAPPTCEMHVRKSNVVACSTPLTVCSN